MPASARASSGRVATSACSCRTNRIFFMALLVEVVLVTLLESASAAKEFACQLLFANIASILRASFHPSIHKTASNTSPPTSSSTVLQPLHILRRSRISGMTYATCSSLTPGHSLPSLSLFAVGVFPWQPLVFTPPGNTCEMHCTNAVNRCSKSPG